MKKPVAPYTGSQAYFFVCYSHIDSPEVYSELERISAAGANLWYDEGIAPGSEWSESLAHAIRNAKALMFFVSPRSIQSKHCRDEVGYAKDNNIPIVCIHLEETQLTEGLKLSLGSSQAIMKYAISKIRYEEKLLNLLETQDINSIRPSPSGGTKSPDRGLIFVAVLICTIGLAAAGNYIYRDRATPLEATLAVTDSRSIAVLPFDSRNTDADLEYFIEGVQDDLLTQLTRVGELKVISRKSVLEYRDTTLSMRQIGQELGVSSLLVGTLQRAGDRVRINTQLIDANSEELLWAETFDREFSPANIFDIQIEIARAITGQLVTAFATNVNSDALDRPPTLNEEAYDLYLQAHAIALDGPIEDLYRAIDLAQRAVELDPEFALAMGKVAEIYTDLYWFTTQDPQHREAARVWLERALDLEPNEPRLQLILAKLLYEGYLDYGAAMVANDKALRGMPGNAQVYFDRGVILRRSGNVEAAIKEFEIAQLLDPRDVFVAAHHLFSFLPLGDVTRARQQGDRVLSLPTATSAHIGFTKLVDTYLLGDTSPMADYLQNDPGVDLGSEDHLKIMVPLMERRYDDTLTALTRLPDPIVEQFNLWTHSYVRALVFHAQGRLEDARQQAALAVVEFDQIAATMLENARPVVARAMMYAILGNDEQARADAKRATELYPVERDQVDGPNYVADGLRALAIIEETEELTRQLEDYLSLPLKLYYVDYILLDPAFDTHRDHPLIKALQEKYSLREQ